jgi:hypothetical protein
LLSKRDPRGPYFCCLLDASRRAAEMPREAAALARRMWLQPGPSIPLELSRRARFRERFLPGYPLIWIEDSVTEILSPFWVRHEWFPLIAALQAGGPPDELPFDLAAALWRAGVLVEPSGEQREAEKKRQTLLDARARFANLGYANVGGVLHTPVLEALSSYYRHLTEAQATIGDTQCDRRYGIHNEGLGRFFHHQIARLVEQIVAEPVVPSYCYFAGYCEGAALKRHTDRAQCEFSVTLLIDYAPHPQATSPWPLWLETRGEPVAVSQALGDMLIYRGTQLPHWRTALPQGHRSYSLLLHYVRSDFTGPLR